MTHLPLTGEETAVQPMPGGIKRGLQVLNKVPGSCPWAALWALAVRHTLQDRERRSMPGFSSVIRSVDMDLYRAGPLHAQGLYPQRHPTMDLPPHLH